MAVTYGFFNSVNGDRKYNAEQMSEYFRGIINEGVYQHLDGGLAVTAGTGLAVNVAAGRAIIQNRWVQNSAAMSLTIAAASETYARKDAVVIRLNWSSRAISIAVKTGTPAASPVAPSMTRNSTTYEMALAYVNVAANATSVTVTDKRSDSTVCGWVTVAQSTSGEVDQMLNDMKTGFDGVVYPSPAAMVQGEDQKLADAIGEDYNINLISKYQFVINSSNKWEAKSDASETFCCAVPVKGGETITAKPSALGSSHIAYLKTFVPVSGETPDFATGQSARIVFTTNYSAIVPSDCRYIYMMTKSNGSNIYPLEFKIDGFDFSTSANENLISISKQMDDNAADIAENSDDIQAIKSVIGIQVTSFPIPYTVDTGHYYYKDGTYMTQSGFCVANIDMTEAIAVEVYGYQAAVMSGIFFVDSNGNAIPDKNGDTYHIPSGSGYNTIHLDKPTGAVGAKASFSISNDRTYSVTGYKYDFGEGIKMPNLADVVMIPIFGQSLSVGAAATPAISTAAKYAAGIMFNGGVVEAQKTEAYFTDFLPLVESTNETPASGCEEKILEQIQREQGLSVLSTYWENHRLLFVSCGAGSKTIADLTTNYYAGLQNAIQGAKNICDDQNLTLNIPCWLWIQGETDQKEDPENSKTATSLADYKAALLALQGNLNTYVKGVTGQTNDIICVCYQSAAQNIVATTKQPAYNNTAVMGVPTAQMQLVRDNSSFIASSPVYILTHSTAEPIHLSAEGSKMLGMYCGLAAKAVIMGEVAPTGLVPLSYTISGTTLEIKYKVPVPPMRIDTEWVKEVAHYGFALLDSNNNDLITGVSVFDDTVTISCSASPLNAMLFYGFNGTQYRDGRIEGSRGNICDSAKYIFDGEIGGKRFAFGNYAYSFVKELSADSGTI